MLGEIPWIFVRIINESAGMERGAMVGVRGKLQQLQIGDSNKKKIQNLHILLKHYLFGFSKRQGTVIFIFKQQLIAETHAIGRIVYLMHVLTTLHGRYYQSILAFFLSDLRFFLQSFLNIRFQGNTTNQLELILELKPFCMPPIAFQNYTFSLPHQTCMSSSSGLESVQFSLSVVSDSF